MDQKELQEKIALYYSKLPPNAQALFSGMNWLKTLTNISQKYGLNEKQKETLGTETTLALLGIIHLVEYEETLTNELGLSADSAEKVLEEIEESIIKTIRPQLVAAYEENKKTTEKTEQKQNRSISDIPNKIESAVEKSNYKAIIYTIAKSYNLTVTQIGVLETAVNDLITGATRPEDFQNFLEKNMKLPLETVRKIANDINEKIFKKIREGLIKNTERKGSPLEEYPVGGGGRSIPPRLEATPQEGNEILDQAGIKVVPDPLAVDVRMEELQSREEMLKKIEKPNTTITNGQLRITNEKDVHPILSQKLTSPIKTDVITTEHSLENITKISTLPQIPDKPDLQKTGYKADPYREIPE